MPYLQSHYAKFKDQCLVVLGFNVSDDRAITREFLRERRVTFPNVLDVSPEAEQVYTRDYRVGTIPLNYLINGDGIVVDGWIGDLEGDARVNSALTKLGGSAAGSEP